MVLAHDVTPQVQSRNTADEADLRAKLAVEAAELGTYEVNLLTNEIVTSKRFDDMADVQRTEEQYRYVAAIHPDDMPIREEALRSAFQTGSLEYEVRVIRKDNTIRWVRIKGRIIFDEKKTPIKHIGVAQDITDEKTSAQELSRKVNERTAALEASRVELEKYVEDLKRSNNNLEQFAYAASHDLKEPIRKIHVFSDMLKVSLKNRLSEHELRSFERMESASKRMSTLIQDLLTYSQFSLLQDKLEEVDLKDVINEVIRDLDLEVEEKHASLTIGPLCRVMGHRRQLQQIFHNLLGNALKYSKPDTPPVINITCNRIQGEKAGLQLSVEEMTQWYYQVIVADNGIGFDMKDAERIFDVFTRLHGNNLTKGTGVGLSIVRKVLLNHKGYIRAESEPGRGSTFILFFPEN
jgi:signal transduction histidine kinase